MVHLAATGGDREADENSLFDSSSRDWKHRTPTGPCGKATSSGCRSKVGLIGVSLKKATSQDEQFKFE